MRRRSRRGEHGIVRGCCFGIVLLVVMIVGLVLALRAMAAPDLGAPPGGTAHGSTEVVIAGSLAGDAGTQLLRGEHAVIALSERDLTVIAQARNPSPDRYRNPEVRLRDGRLVVSAQTSIGPFGVTAVARLTLTFDKSGGSPQITTRVTDYSLGQLGVPGIIGDRFNPRATTTTFNLSTLFAASPALESLSQSMECVSVTADGMRVAFHRPGVTDDPNRCMAAAAPA